MVADDVHRAVPRGQRGLESHGLEAVEAHEQGRGDALKLEFTDELLLLIAKMAGQRRGFLRQHGHQRVALLFADLAEFAAIEAEGEAQLHAPAREREPMLGPSLEGGLGFVGFSELKVDVADGDGGRTVAMVTAGIGDGVGEGGAGAG